MLWRDNITGVELEGTKRAELDALLAVYSEIKAEIGRRSALSWAVVGGYLVFASTALNAIMSSYGTSRTVVWITITWIAAAASASFYKRENSEILRLSNLIRGPIETRYKQILRITTHEPLFMERYDPQNVWARTAFPQRVAEYAAFLGVPVALMWIVYIPVPDVVLSYSAFFSAGVGLACILHLLRST